MNSRQLQNLLEQLYPINRSLTGDGNRKTLKILQEVVEELRIVEVPSGTEAFDWTIPKEWRVNGAYIEDLSGKRIVDFNLNNLHLVGYSSNFKGVISKSELLEHIHTIPELPHAIPYITSYYQDYWGFCIAHNQLSDLEDEFYNVVVDTEHFEGTLTYGEIFLPGDSTREVVFSTYICHPSLANNELSGPIVAIALADFLKKRKDRKLSYRFLFLPETIGAIYYLSRNLTSMKERTLALYVLTCLGDNRGWSLINSRSTTNLADQVADFALKDLNKNVLKYPFTSRGSDERQYGAPLIDLPVTTIMRSKFGTFVEYHNSLDNLELVNGVNLAESLELLKHIINIHEKNEIYENVIQGEPWLTKRGMTRINLENRFLGTDEKLLMDFLAYADGRTPLIQIAQSIGINFATANSVVEKLLDLKLIRVRDE